ncbi:MAG: class I SAM-dependent methyltransferase [Coriobacteriia bacterium]|nr:class I SAM-dependent methyltransferase [Coriobacteriia bacterium]
MEKRHDVCPWQHGSHLAGPVRKLFNNPRRLLERYVVSGMTVADIGSGMGFLTLPLADMVGEDGQVIAVDLQPEMLEGLKARAQKAGVTNIVLHQCARDSLGIEQYSGSVGVALIYWMLHEVGDPERLIQEVHEALAPEGKLLFVEPNGHVSEEKFQDSLEMIIAQGFTLVERPKVSISRAAVLQKN